VKSLVALNNLLGNGNAIYAGEVLKVPGLTAAAPIDIAVAGYYRGSAGSGRTGRTRDTKAYVRNVLRIKSKLENGWNPVG
jgi:hypothetical protein